MNTHSFLAAAMFFYVLYIFALGFLMFKKRKKAVQDKKISSAYFKSYNAGETPDDLLVMSRHFDNQFQVPMLFLITGSVLLNFVDLEIWVVCVAWAFVFSRMLHSYVHLGANNVLNRAKAFGLGLICVLILWFKILITFL